MSKTSERRVPLSVNIVSAAKQALLERAEREGHRYPAVLAATLLERALAPNAGGGAEVREALARLGVLAEVREVIERGARSSGVPAGEALRLLGLVELDNGLAMGKVNAYGTKDPY